VFKRIGRRINSLLTVVGILAVVVVVTPISEYLARPLRLEREIRPAEAIVVLGGGSFEDGLPAIPSLVRAVYGFSLFRAGYAPKILLSGGQVRSDLGIEAMAMKKLLEDIGAPPKSLETEGRSTRTYSNATESARILQGQGITRILLVSHSNHMRRAKWTFEKAGFIVYPAPIPWDRLPKKENIFSLKRVGLMRSVVHEYGGLVLYWWKGWL